MLQSFLRGLHIPLPSFLLLVNRFSVSGCALSTSSQIAPSDVASYDLLVTNSSSPMLIAVYNFPLNGDYGNVTATVLDSTLNAMYSFPLPESPADIPDYRCLHTTEKEYPPP